MSGGAAADIRGVAKGGIVTLLGAAVSTAMGFVLVMVLARQLGASGSGVVQQAIAAFMIALALARLGMDTTAVWVVPRLRVGDPRSLRGATVALLAWALLGGVAVAGGWLLVDRVVSGPLLGDREVDRTVTAIAWALPAASMLLVALAITRGFGALKPFNLIGNVALPAARPVVVLVITLAGGGALASALGWAVLVVPALMAALWVLIGQVRRAERATGAGGWRPSRDLHRQLVGFGLPRTLATMLEQAIIWIDVIIVGVLAGPEAAGVYGVASRFVAGGMVALTAMRIVIAPQFSSRLAAREYREAEELNGVTSTWIVLFGTPVYVLLAAFASTVLGLVGGDFGAGRSAMVILCVGGIAQLAGGNIQSLLLMSGRSGWGAINKAVVLAVNLALNLALVPVMGIEGAAISWAACMALDAVLAAFQVWRFTGISPATSRIAVALLAAVAVSGIPSLLAWLVLGNTVSALSLATVFTGILVIGFIRVASQWLHFDQLSGMVRSRRGM